MKKVLLIIIISVVSVYASAQDASSAPVSIDSLSLRLEQLQHDYDYLLCDFELYRMKAELNELSQDALIKTNGILINIYNSRYNRDLYSAYLRNYDVYCALFDTQKEKYGKIKTMVMLKSFTSGFSDTQLDVIKSTFDSIEKSISSVDSALKYYKFAVDSYREIR